MVVAYSTPEVTTGSSGGNFMSPGAWISSTSTMPSGGAVVGVISFSLLLSLSVVVIFSSGIRSVVEDEIFSSVTTSLIVGEISLLLALVEVCSDVTEGLTSETTVTCSLMMSLGVCFSSSSMVVDDAVGVDGVSVDVDSRSVV